MEQVLAQAGNLLLELFWLFKLRWKEISLKFEQVRQVYIFLACGLLYILPGLLNLAE